jgi:hypothetical protein
MGLLSIDANMFASLLILPIVKLEQLELIDAFFFPLSQFQLWSLLLAGRQFRSWSSVTSVREQGITGEGRDYCASEPCASKPAKVLQIAWYARIANSFVLSVSHLHSQSVGAPTVYDSLSIWGAQLIRVFLQAASSMVAIPCKTTRRIFQWYLLKNL